MENTCDIEDIVPPTPEVQLNKVCSRINKTSITTSKLSRKIPKMDTNGFKRKRIVSPNKKVKQKVKQVTLYNFLLKTSKNAGDMPLVNTKSKESIPSKVNLLDRLEETQIKSDTVPVPGKNYAPEKGISSNVNSWEKEMYEDDMPFVNTESKETIPAKVNLLDRLETNQIKNGTVPVSYKIYESEKNTLSNVNKCVKEICEDVATLDINLKNTSSSVINDERQLSKTVDATDLNNQKLENRTELNEMLNGEELESMEMTFSWLTNEDLENDKKIFDISCNFDVHDLSNFSTEHFKEDYHIKFKVKEVIRIPGNNEIKLVLAAKNDSTVVRHCSLKGFWTDTIINVGDTVHILNPAWTDKAVVDNDYGFFIVNPDFLISSTAVVSTLFCMRKAALNHILPQWSPGNNIMMIGSLVHDIFQKSVNSHVTTAQEVMEIVKSVMEKRDTLIALCCQGASKNEIEEKIKKYIPNIIDWIKKHCSFNGQNTFTDISIRQVEDIEENVWCPKYGIKGKIDMTVNAYCQNQAKSKSMPLELKTGRPTYSAEHIGQVNLYSLMLEERSKEQADGLLLYLRDKAEMKVINTNHNSKRGLIQLRNELASYVYRWVSSNQVYKEIEQCALPDPINNKRNCEKCPYLLPCTVYQKAFPGKLLEPSHAMNKLVPTSTRHLSDSDIQYFVHWSRLLLLENTTAAEVKAFWTEDSVSREKQGLCLSHVLLNENISIRHEVNGYFIHTFIRLVNNPVSPNFKNSCLKEGDYVAISNEKNSDEVALAMGYIVKTTEHFVEFATERNLKTIANLKGMLFRIDKIISNSAAACVRNNLMLLMQDEDISNKLRKLVIDKETPKFLESLPKQIVLLGRPILKALNKNQQKAVLKGLMAEDYFLIKGMPGTGKTSTIVALVRLLIQMGVSVLLTSYTHSAIDNILLKLKEYSSFVRIGPKYRIHPEILEYSFENLTKDFNSVDQFSEFIKKQMVVATTSLGINHAVFKIRKFDVCIVDEASQINQIACLGPLFFAKKFILVGDDKQLPPLVLNSEARQRGMQESLFQRLQNSVSCLELTMQYRMNQEIMRLCNELTYEGRLQCGSEAVANAVLYLDKKNENHNEAFPAWLMAIFETDIKKSVYFLNTDNCEDSNSQKDKNEIEANIVISILKFLLQCDVLNSEIGIIAPYRRQVNVIEAKLRNLCTNDVEVNTVDQYQGRDKDVIIISCVKPGDSLANTEKAEAILDDERRLNVAISRARKKLIVIGSKTSLLCHRPFQNLIRCLRVDQQLNIT